ncbi:MAG: hypothetical protein WCS89_00450 [Candidatus Paceibacterota bacterium]
MEIKAKKIEARVWSVPAGQTEEDLQKIHWAIVRAVTGIPELGIKDHDRVVCMFPDNLREHSSKSVIIEVKKLMKLNRAGRVHHEIVQKIKRGFKEAARELGLGIMAKCPVKIFSGAE